MDKKTHTILAVALIGASSYAHADGASVGPDGWTRSAEQLGLFNPHENYCDPTTELFLDLGNSGRGFCIEANVRGNGLWVDAKQDCLSDKMRLPEPAEWYYACNYLTGFSAIQSPSGVEWVSNSSNMVRIDSTNKTGIAAPLAADVNNCSYASVGWAGYAGTAPVAASFYYRCMR